MTFLRRWACVAMLLSFASCDGRSAEPHLDDGGTSSADEGVLDANGPSIPADDPECRRMGVSYRAGCSDCPSAPINCPCFDPDGALPMPPLARCSSGHCALGVDCDEVCRSAASMDGQPSLQFYLDLGKLQECLRAPVCRSDDWCAPHNKCWGETTAPFGVCTTGDVGVPCADRSDCWSNICATDNLSATLCRDGMPRSFCNESADCASANCVLYDSRGGLCTAGQVGDPCHEGDCQPGTFCVRYDNFGGLGLGTCHAGQLDERCDTADQCLSKICLDNSCFSGALNAVCKSDQDCLSGYCMLKFGQPNEHGICVSGNRGDRCNFANNCKIGLCSLKHGPYGTGACYEGKLDDPCVQDADCPGLRCDVPAQPGQCRGQLSGQPCGGRGICDAEELCEFGKCVAM